MTLPHSGPVVPGLPYYSPSRACGLPHPPELLQIPRTRLYLPSEKSLALGIPSAIPDSQSHSMAQAEFKTLMVKGEASTVSQIRLTLSRGHLPREL